MSRGYWIRLCLQSAMMGLMVWGGSALGQTAGSAGGAAAGAFGGLGTSMGGTTAPTATAATPSAADAMLYPGEDFRLGPGDLITVRVFQESDYQATVRVDGEGNVLLPFIGSVNIGDLTVRAAQLLIADRLRSEQYFKDPEVIIQVVDTVNGSVIITGELRASVPVTRERSLREVLLLAGGLPASASHTVKIVRPGLENPIVVNLGTDLASSGAADVPVRPHDIIQITRASVVYILGAFQHQGAFPLDQASPLTLLQVAALGGGINFEGKFDDLRLIRTVGVNRELVDVDIKKVREGKAPDPILQPNDIVFLPTDNMKALLKSLGTGGVIGIVTSLIAIRNL